MLIFRFTGQLTNDIDLEQYLLFARYYFHLVAIFQAMMREDDDTLIRCEISSDKINLHVDNDTLLMKAVVLKSLTAAQILLEKNADPNVVSKLGPRHGKSPLMVATEMVRHHVISKNSWRQHF